MFKGARRLPAAREAGLLCGCFLYYSRHGMCISVCVRFVSDVRWYLYVCVLVVRG